MRALTLAERRNLIAFVSGMKGSGKSELLAELFAQRAPRVIELDVNGEAAERNADAIVTYGLAELVDALDVAADFDRWHIAASLEDAELPELCALLVPRMTDRSAGVGALFGGVALLCGECDTVAPNGRTLPAVKDLFKRGRHHLLSLLMGTQRPAECDRLVTSQANFIAFFQATEGRELDFAERALSRPVARYVAELPAYHFALFERGTAFVRLCRGPVGAREVFATVDLRGRLLSGALPAELAAVAP